MFRLASGRAAQRLLVALPALVLGWGLATNLPLAGDPAQPGRLETETVVLTGPDAEAVPEAGAPGKSARRREEPATAGWSAAIDLDDGTEMVALSWRGAPTGVIELRSQAGGAWSTWDRLETDPDGDSEEGNGRLGSGLVWLGPHGADRVEVRVATGPLDDLRLQAMRWIEPTPGDGVGAAPAQPFIQPRSDWAPGPFRCGTPAEANRLSFAVVHHTASGNDYNPDQVAGILAGIYKYETEGLGWCDLAYNFVIDKFGRIWEGRSGSIAGPVIGGHARGFNTGSMGVAFLGQHHPGASPSPAHQSPEAGNALRDLLAWKFGLSGLDPEGTVTLSSGGSPRYAAGQQVTLPRIHAHRDNGRTACPGDHVYADIPQVRRDVAARVGATSYDPVRWAPFTAPDEVTDRQYRDFLRRAPSSDELGQWRATLEGGAEPEDLITMLLASAEFDDRVASVTRLYSAFFNRIPDYAGLTFWLGQHQQGVSIPAITAAFANSVEFRTTYDGLSNREMVRQVYLNVLEREPETGGSTYWTGRLDRQEITRGGLVEKISQSAEHSRVRGTEVQVAMTYTAMLQRAPYRAEFADWNQRIDGGTSIRDLVAQLYRSADYASVL